MSKLTIVRDEPSHKEFKQLKTGEIFTFRHRDPKKLYQKVYYSFNGTFMVVDLETGEVFTIAGSEEIKPIVAKLTYSP